MYWANKQTEGFAVYLKPCFKEYEIHFYFRDIVA